MLNVLKFVQGAVGRKDLVPALTHFRIKDGRITGYNGKIALSAPVPLDIDCVPKAVPLVRAIEACSDTAQLHMTASGKLSIRSGKFRAHVDTLPDDVFPDIGPDGRDVYVGGPLLPAMRALYDITSDDATRPWATGVLLDGECAYATNNVVLAQFWLGCHFPYRVTVPRYAIKEMLRIGEEPINIQLTTTSITFHYEGERWLRSQLHAIEWPDLNRALSLVPGESEVPPVPEGLWDALDTLAPFTDEQNRVYMLGARVATALEEGASVEVDDVPGIGIYNHKMLSLLNGLAHKLDLSAYPAPCPWYGDGVRGVLIGMRV